MDDSSEFEDVSSEEETSGKKRKQKEDSRNRVYL